MRTNPLRVVTLLSLFATGCTTESYGPYSPDYYPEFPDETRAIAPHEIVETDGPAKSTNSAPQREALLLYTTQPKY